MRIANNSSDPKRALRKTSVSLGMLGILLGLLPLSGAAYADPAIAPPMNAPSAPLIAPPPAQNTASMDPATPDTAKSIAGDMNKTTTAMEEKVSESAKGLVKRLDKSADAMTLEDMNEARQTIVRIEAMIDIEKRLGELEKLRKDRNGEGSGPALASAIPASALNPMSHMPPMPAFPMMPADDQVIHRAVPVAANLEIARIIGTEGRYTAVIKLGNGDLKSVRVGDQVSSDVTVQAIASSSVVLDEHGKTHTLHIKNVDVIYSAMR